MNKICNTCKEPKKISAFGKDKNKTDGHKAACKPCYNSYLRKHYKKDPTNSKVISKKRFDKFYCSINGRATHLLNNAKGRARRQGVECDLTQDWIIKKLKEGICEVTKLPLSIEINGGKGHINNSFAPSLDRITQKGNYTPENCRVVCWIYNRARGAFPDEDLIIMSKALARLSSH